MDWTKSKIQDKILDIINLNLILSGDSRVVGADDYLHFLRQDEKYQIARDVEDNFIITVPFSEERYWYTVKDIVIFVALELLV